MSQTMLFRPGKMLRVWGRFDVDFITVPAADVGPYLSRGWYERPGGWEVAAQDVGDDRLEAAAEQPKRRGRKPKGDEE